MLAAPWLVVLLLCGQPSTVYHSFMCYYLQRGEAVFSV